MLTILPYYNLQTANYTLQSSDDVVQFNCSSGSLIATLPTAVGFPVGKRLEIRRAADATPSNALTINTTSSQTIDGRSSGSIHLSPSDYAILVSDGSNWQVVTLSESVSARYYNSTTTITSSLSTVVWSVKDFDSHSAMSLSTGIYTVQVNGKYKVISNISNAGSYSLNNTIDMQIQKNGSVVSEQVVYSFGSESNVATMVSDIINCVAGDQIRVQLSNTATSPGITSSSSRNYFSIAKVGN